MKLKPMFFVLLLAVIALNALPVCATDFSGYVEAPYYTSWTLKTPPEFHPSSDVNPVLVQGGMVYKYLGHWYVNNTGDFALTNAIMAVEVVQIWYMDESGVIHYIFDPAEIGQHVGLENSNYMWQGGYVIRLGTIRPGHSQRFCLNWWYEVLSETFQGWGYSFRVFYLP